MRSTRSTGRSLLSVAAFVLLALTSGCSSAPRPRAGYDRRVDALDGVDASRLAGRRIALDPGHGGYFRGALGVRGLTEADVNLGVALELARLLRARGAEVLLTRETDRDFLSPADSSLRSDLAERTRLANAFRPDLLISVHHNADARGAHDVNETQVYFQLGDDGPALDAAADVQRFLTRNLGIGASRLVPGNFAVLRGSEAPALLTESSYITYPPTEKRLAREDARRMEAEALYLGIAAYFSRRAPQVERLNAWAANSAPGDTVFSTGFVRLWGRVRGAFDAATLTVDGIAVPALREGGDLSWRAVAPLAAGLHEATLVARLAGEGSSRRGRVRFEVRPVPESLVIEIPDQPYWDGRELLGVRLRALSREGVAIRDSLAIRVRDAGSDLLAPADTTVTLRDGVAWAYFRPSGRPARDHGKQGLREVELRAAWADTSGALPAATARAALPLLPQKVPESFTFFALLMPEGAPLRDAPGTREPEPAVRWINRDGFVRTPTLAAVRSDRLGLSSSTGVPSLPGYRPWESDTLRPARFVAIAGGALHSRRIVLDPAGGGDDNAGTSASGGRGAALNLEVARMLSSMLTAAGAQVRMTRSGDAPASDLERVRLSEEFRAERFLRIAHPSSPPRLGHYFASAAGKRWAARLAGIAAELGLPRPATGDDAQYPIQQASATALSAGLGRVDEAGAPFGGYDPARLRIEAYALYLGLAREWAADARWPLDSIEVRDPAGRPRAGALVRLGDMLMLESDSLGRVRFARTEPGPMRVRWENSATAMERVLLDSDHAIVLPGPASP